MSGVIFGAAVLLAVTFIPGIVARASSVARMRRLSRGKLALTYDDGPSSEPTPQILDLLRSHRARATFFVCGRQTRRGSGTCDRIVAEGHELGAHGFAHRHAWRDPFRAYGDALAGLDAVAPWTEGRTVYRPPFGKATLWTLLAARARGARPVWWTVDSRDSWARQPDIDAVVAHVDRAQGGVVLMHDFERDPASPPVRYTLALTERLLRLAAERRWEVCTVSELLGARTAARRHDAGADVAPRAAARAVKP